MTDDERQLLNNLLDSFDRLFDRESGVVDTQALLFATARALRGSELAPEIERVAGEISAIFRSQAPKAEQSNGALDVVDDLRRRLAKVL